MDDVAVSRAVARQADVFERVEHLAYAAVGVLLSIAAAIALAGAVWALARQIQDWGSTGLIAELIERLLFVLMLVEILHTVRASLRHGGLRAEPFLIVGIIASIRRVLVSTLETTEAGQATDAGFHNKMLELGVLGFLIIVMVVAIHLLRRREPPHEGHAPEDEQAAAGGAPGRRPAAKARDAASA